MSVRLMPIERSHSVDGLSPEAADACRATVALYGAGGFVPPWIGYLATTDGGIAGTCAFTAPPRDGRVEIVAHTRTEQNASTAVPRRLGFVRDGTAVDPDEGVVWRWTRAAGTTAPDVREPAR